jgi:hypothetical protein
MPGTNGKKVIVVGAGLGGMSAALSLALEGCQVVLFEKNPKVGGKLNVLSSHGYRFDLGPSILTLPHLFARTFEKAGKRLEDYVPLCTVRPHWRNLFEDGTVVDLHPEDEPMAEEMDRAGEPRRNLDAFLEYSGKLYDLVNRGYFEQGLDSVGDFRSFYGLLNFLRFDIFRSMHQSVERHFKTRYFVDIFDFFIKYVGSSAYRAPAFMNCMSTIQFRHDLWYVMGGMYNLAVGLEKLMRELGIRIELNAEVSSLIRSGDGQGVMGLDMTQTEFGPGLVYHLAIRGFDTGIATPAHVSNAVLESITLTNQNKVGIDNRHATAIHKLRSDNVVPAVRHRGGHLVLIDAELVGGGKDAVAIEATGDYYLRDVRSVGYRAALGHDGQVVPGRVIRERLSGRAHTLGNGSAKSLNLPVRQPPAIFREPADRWRIVEPRKGDSTAMLQEAMNSGAATIFLHSGTYQVNQTIRVPATVRRILSSRGATLKGSRENFAIGGLTNPVEPGFGGARPFLRLEGRTDRSITIERVRLSAWPHRAHQIEIATPRPVLIRHGAGGHPGGEIRTARGSAGGSLFLVETGSDLRIEGDYVVFARQYNPENNPFRPAHRQTMMRRTYVINDGARVWVLGFKTESPAIHVITRNGGQTEVLGGFFRDHFGPEAGLAGKDLEGEQVPYFIVENAVLSAMYAQFASQPGAARSLQLVARRGEHERKIELSSTTFNVPLIRADTRPDVPGERPSR